MTLLIFALLLSVAAALLVIRPLLARNTALLADLAPGAVIDAEARKRVTLAALKDLEYDYLGGKLDETDYRSQKDLLSREALEAIQAASVAQAGWDGNAAEGARIRVSKLDIKLALEAGRHACGFVNRAGSRFCAGCGARLR